MLPFGHESLSNASVATLVRILPSDVRLVVEDAITDVLLRSAATTRSVASKRIGLVARDPSAVNRALSSGDVLAMPRAQNTLQNSGFRLTDAQPGVGGLSRVTAGGTCTTVTDTWTTVPALAASARVALIADASVIYDHAITYLASDRPLSARPVDWPDRARRGFDVSVYDTSLDRDRRRLDQDVTGDRAPRQASALSAPFVTRLELWRVPGGPLQLVVGLDRAPFDALTGRTQGAEEPGLHVCPAFEHAATRLAPPR
jgi:hypothetical protein